MQDRNLLFLALLGSLGGISLLYMFAIGHDPQLVTSSDLDKHEGEIVRCEGQVIYITQSEADHIFLEVRDESGTFIVPIYSDIVDSVDEIRRGDYVSVVGKVQKYGDDTEIIISQSDDIKVTPLEVSNYTSINNESFGWLRKIRGKFIDFFILEDDIFLEIYYGGQSMEVVCFDLYQNLRILSCFFIIRTYSVQIILCS